MLYPISGNKRDKVITHNPNHQNGDDFRSGFRKDLARLIHSACFRRLQGKTQLFPGIESDFFRNRLTHSIEVAQIAKGIAIHINNKFREFSDDQIDYDLVEFASLAHDIGHPPFGHNGEAALHEIMKEDFGFEGNAQTLRILSTLEKKYLIADGLLDEKGRDTRYGLNLTYRALASILKYDSEIPEKSGSDPIKGFYQYDTQLVTNIKKKLLGSRATTKKFKTIECSIMDIADDIAYSTYDFEDSLKAQFINILDVINPELSLFQEITKRVERNVRKEGIDKTYTEEDVHIIFIKLIMSVLEIDEEYNATKLPSRKKSFLVQAAELYDTFKKIASDGALRTSLTSGLVNRFINGVKVEYDDENPFLSKVYLDTHIREEVEVLKNLTFVGQIESSRVKVSEFRGKEIVREIFKSIHETPNGYKLMPDDFKLLYTGLPEHHRYRKRIVVDFIAGMTDRYAIEFYSRLKSENPQTIFKPL
ncbi:MAG TPA: dNTP triphosphohydrolase [Cyclobacteriaceae bacterium]|nr:dNTP triphosphohydrolase [Cyclobacteriaceae bacterium]